MSANFQTGNFNPEQWPFGYQDGVGLWSIDVPIERERLNASLSERVSRALERFENAASGFLRPARARFESLSFNEQGRIASGSDGAVNLPETGRSLAAQFSRQFSPDGNSVPTTIFVTCDCTIVLPSETSRAGARIELRNSGEFYLGYLLDPGNDDIPVVTNCRVSFETYTDVWLARTRHPQTMEWRDNSAAARLNELALERFLREWERNMQHSIADWESRLYREQIDRYGFRNT